MIEFHRWKAYHHENGKVGFTHLVVAGGLVLQSCGIWHTCIEEKCDTAENWVLVRAATAS